MSANSVKKGSAEMRSAARFPVRWPVELEHGVAYTRDISSTGMFLRCPAAMDQKATFRFSVLLPKRAGVVERLECEGRAIRIERYADGWFGIAVALLGFQFRNLSTLVT